MLSVLGTFVASGIVFFAWQQQGTTAPQGEAAQPVRQSIAQQNPAQLQQQDVHRNQPQQNGGKRRAITAGSDSQKQGIIMTTDSIRLSPNTDIITIDSFHRSSNSGSITADSMSESKIRTDTLIATTFITPTAVINTSNSSKTWTIPLINIYEPDDATLKRLGFVRFGKDSVVRHTTTVEPWRSSIERTTLFPSNSSSMFYVTTDAASKYPVSEIHEVYTATANGRIQMFSNEVIGCSRQSWLKEYLKERGEWETLEKIAAEEKRTNDDGIQTILEEVTDSSFVVGNVRSVRSAVEASNPKYWMNTVRKIYVSTTRDEQRQMWISYSSKLSELRQAYRDSCVVLRVRCGDTGVFHFLYRPTPEFLAQLPNKAALQIRAELGNRDALQELRRSYKGCTFMSFCRTADGAIQQSSILGTSSESIRVAFTLSQQRTVRIALYTMAGGLAAEIDPGSMYAAGDHTVPLNVRSESDGFYLLTLTTADREKITHRVVIDK